MSEDGAGYEKETSHGVGLRVACGIPMVAGGSALAWVWAPEVLGASITGTIAESAWAIPVLLILLLPVFAAWALWFGDLLFYLTGRESYVW